MSFFKQVEGEAAVIVENGVYKQVDLYTRDGFLYAKASGGFIRLMADGATSKAKCRMVFMSWSGQLYTDGMGKLAAERPTSGRPLLADEATKLLGGAQ